MARGRPPKNLTLVIAVLAESQNTIGINNAQIREATGLTAVAVSSAVLLLKRTGRAFVLGHDRDARWFPTAERLEACRPTFDAYMVQLRASRRQAKLDKNAKRGREYRASLGLKKPGPVGAKKPAKQTKAASPAPRVMTEPQKAWMDAPVNIKKPPKCNFKDQPAIVPKDLQVQKLPGCPERSRFTPPPWFKGEFTKEFEMLRGDR